MSLVLNSGTGLYSASGSVGSGSISSIPSGVINPYAGATAPDGWLLCFGQTISRSTYSSLFAVLSTIYGAGDGSTTFTLPDLRGRFLAGKDDMGGSAASRLTNSATGGVVGSTLGATGGEQAHSLTSAENGPHTHNFTYNYAVSAGTNIAGNFSTGGSTISNVSAGSVVQSSGSGTAHNVIPPTIVVSYIIKT